MKVKEAKAITTEWVLNFSKKHSSFHSAYLAGSIVDREEETTLPPSSDLDVLIILNQEEIPLKPGKIRFHHVLLDVTYLPWSQFHEIEGVLSSYHLANSLKHNTILLDPTYELHNLQLEVARQFPKKKWVEARCEDAMKRITNNLNSLTQKSQWADQVMAWLFGTGVMCHVLLIAGLENPTIRLRYLTTRTLLTTYQQETVYEKLLDLLGCKELGAERLLEHLDHLEQTFDAAVSHAKTPFFFSSDITADARVIAIDGSRELIVAGNHREAVFWIVATFARCHQIFNADALNLSECYKQSFQLLLEDLGIHDVHDLEQRSTSVRAYLPTLKASAMKIMDENPSVIDE
ncbi:hypothetical protein [Alkalicoccobacillus porphyridii]|uniref:Uncharacterized protein n=1 Tax=Alkalicoccobacillus porphyridii TaxID=2597270 RepID=A0A553ZX62_9BACI|nr:hypothetical protein [Alkalicoccobacillus porphyridii]TSB46050.1 hypothetical protein FN960_14225 [Alkalicoccobacillus porphyridii]